MSLALLLVAIVLALWAAFVHAEYITYGDYFFLVALSLAAGWASLLPWRR